MTYKVYIDGYNLIPYLTGEAKESPRNNFFYVSDDGEIMAVRFGDWKCALAIQRENQLRVWSEPLVKLRLPYIFNLRRDPFERAEYNSNTWLDWTASHAFIMYQMQDVVGGAIGSYAAFPPRQKPGSFNLDRVMETVMAGSKQ